MNEPTPTDHPVTPDQTPVPIPAQAATVLRATDALSRAFWLSIFGTLLVGFLAGLASIESGDPQAAIELGEYAIPKSILPATSLGFALFTIWLTSNRLQVMERILADPRFNRDEVIPLLETGTLVFDIFSPDNYRRWSLSNGLSMLLLVWSLYFGLGALLAFTSAVERSATAFEFEWRVLVVYVVIMGLSLWYGSRAVLPPVGRIMQALHGRELILGWPRTAIFYLTLITPLVIQNVGLLVLPDAEVDDYLGPVAANVVDGETLYISGVVVKLFGIDAPEPDQACFRPDGTRWFCGQQARNALQQLIAGKDVLCNPIFPTADNAVVGACTIFPKGSVIPSVSQFYAGDGENNLAQYSLSRQLVQGGHVLAVGIGANVYAAEFREARMARRGIWAGAFEPPWIWRARQRNR